MVMGSAGRTQCTRPRGCSLISRPAPLFQIEPVICGHLQRLLIDLTKPLRRPGHRQFNRRGPAGHGSNFGLISTPPGTPADKEGSGVHPASDRRRHLQHGRAGHPLVRDFGQFFGTGRILALCDPGGCNPVLGGAVAFAPYPTVVKSLIDRLSSPGAPGALAFRLVSASAGCPVQ